MDEKEQTEVPLSNQEVFQVLKARDKEQKHHPRTLEMIEYLEAVYKLRCPEKKEYPLEILRDLAKDLNANLITLATVANISDLSILDTPDRKKIEQFFAKKR